MAIFTRLLTIMALVLQTGAQFGRVNPFYEQATVNRQAALGQCTITGRDFQGPYFVNGAPRTNGQICTAQNDLIVTGAVFGADGSNCSVPVQATINLWQANAQGQYSNVGGALTGFQCRAIVQTRGPQQNQFTLLTTYPGIYPGRPRHIHATVTSPGYQTLTTQLYFSDDNTRTNGRTICGGCNRPSQLLQVTRQGASAVRTGVWNIYLQK